MKFCCLSCTHTLQHLLVLFFHIIQLSGNMLASTAFHCIHILIRLVAAKITLAYYIGHIFIVLKNVTFKRAQVCPKNKSYQKGKPQMPQCLKISTSLLVIPLVRSCSIEGAVMWLQQLQQQQLLWIQMYTVKNVLPKHRSKMIQCPLFVLELKKLDMCLIHVYNQKKEMCPIDVVVLGEVSGLLCQQNNQPSSLHNMIFNSFRLVLVLWRLFYPQQCSFAERVRGK